MVVISTVNFVRLKSMKYTLNPYIKGNIKFSLPALESYFKALAAK
ncbi:MAG: hypothetical protein OFPII_06110 [Osedax symbiont Rs1]|nr:MAG: hypothetical protein OFPII_06110 [Osedax symbiont Rs1]